MIVRFDVHVYAQFMHSLCTYLNTASKYCAKIGDPPFLKVNGLSLTGFKDRLLGDKLLAHRNLPAEMRKDCVMDREQVTSLVTMDIVMDAGGGGV